MRGAVGGGLPPAGRIVAEVFGVGIGAAGVGGGVSCFAMSVATGGVVVGSVVGAGADGVALGAWGILFCARVVVVLSSSFGPKRRV